MDAKTLESLLAEEAELQFPKFDSAAAWKLGNWLVSRAKKDNLAIAVAVTRGGQRLFHWAADGTCVDNDHWIDRKNRSVYRWGHSTYFLNQKLVFQKTNGPDKWAVDPAEYAFDGGAFPIFVRGSGLVGTVTVSGLKQHEDHALAVEAVRALLRR